MARSKGYGFVQFNFPEVALIAAKAMNGYLLEGKKMMVHVLGVIFGFFQYLLKF